MFPKTRAGDRFPPTKSARWINAVTDAAAFYQQQQALGKGVSADKGIVVPKCQNMTGADRNRGEVLGIGTLLLTENSRYHPWFEGNAYADGDPFVITRAPIPNSEIGEVVADGVCLALVNVSDLSHKFAVPVPGEYSLDSAEAGPVRLLSAASGTGDDQELWVLVAVEPGDGTGGGEWQVLAVADDGGDPGDASNPCSYTYELSSDPSTYHDLSPSFPVRPPFGRMVPGTMGIFDSEMNLIMVNEHIDLTTDP